MKSLIVFSHQRWDFQFHRTQQLLSRLARSYRVFFFEEPQFDSGPAWLEMNVAAPDLLVCRPHTAVEEAGFTQRQMAPLERLLAQLVASQELHAPVAWFCTPMALPLLRVLDPGVVVYDCMDEPGAFQDAPPERLQCEEELLKAADLVFTAGPSQFRSKEALHRNVHDFAVSSGKVSDAVKGPSWDATVARMRALMDLAGQQRRRRRDPAPSRRPLRRNAVVIGAGPTGLSAAYHLGPQSLLLEQNSSVGGSCRTIEEGGFVFDQADHILFSGDPYVHEMYRMLLGENVHWQQREEWIYSKDVYTRHPFQGALYGLPADVLKECLVGAIEAHFGALKGQHSARANGSCGDGLVEGMLKQRATHAIHGPDASGSFANFEDFIFGTWGSGIARHFAIPYYRKFWTVPLHEIEPSWLAGCIPLPDLGEMIEGALRAAGIPQGSEARFGYPLRGGIQALVDGFLPRLRGELRLNARVARVLPSKHQVVLADGTTIAYQKLISTMPLPGLIHALGEDLPPPVAKAAGQLRHVSVRCVNLGIGREPLFGRHLIHYPGSSLFHRVFLQGNASPHNNPSGGFGLTCEISYSPHKPLPCDGAALIERCIDDCIRAGLIRHDDPVMVRNQVDIPYACVLYDHARARNVQVIREWLKDRDIELAGRNSEWEYGHSEHAFVAGKKAADRVTEALARKRSTPPTAREVVAKLLEPVITPASSGRRTQLRGER